MSLSTAEAKNKRKTNETYCVLHKRKKLKLQEDTNRFDIVGNLPPELGQMILFHLRPPDLRAALKTCTKWKNLACDNYFWKRKCKIDKFVEMSEAARSEVYESFVNGSDNYWERIYFYNEALHQNWQTYEFNETIFDVRVGFPIIHYFDDEFAIMTSRIDRDHIFVYNYRDEKRTHFTLPRNAFCDCLISKTLNFIVFANKMENCLYVCCIETGAYKLKLKLPYNIVRFITDKHLVAIQLCNRSWQIVNILSGEVEYKTGIEDPISCVCFHEGLVAFGFCSGVIKVMNWSNKFTTTVFIHDKEIDKILVGADNLISFTKSDTCIWSLQNKTKLNSRQNLIPRDVPPSAQNCVLLNSRTLLQLDYEVNDLGGVFEAWDILDNIVKYQIAVTEDELVHGAIITNNHYIFTYYKTWIEEGEEIVKIKVWCQRTGRCVARFNLLNDFDKLLVTNTKLVPVVYDIFESHMFLQDFEKKIDVDQLNMLTSFDA